MKMENVAMALSFLEGERIKLVSIDAQAIVDGNLKLILGLIWTLILHYSISMPMWEGEDEASADLTPKQRLLGWIQNKIPQLPITNFSRDWQDGRALGALVDNCAPGTQIVFSIFTMRTSAHKFCDVVVERILDIQIIFAKIFSYLFSFC